MNPMAVIAQTLIKRKDGKGRVAAFETLVAIPAIRNLIREAKTFQTGSMIQIGLKQGSITLDRYLAMLVKKGIVDRQEAER